MSEVKFDSNNKLCDSVTISLGMNARNTKIDKMADYASFGNIASFVSYLWISTLMLSKTRL